MSASAAVSSIDGRVKMLDGNEIPMLGLGVYEMSDKETYDAVKWALEAGYRHVDTAEWYENEASTGKAVNEFIAKTKTPRSEIFICSKLKTNRSYDRTLSDLKSSLQKSKLDYFDLYLMHSAIGGKEVRAGVWKACMEAKKMGLVKSIGVSNFGAKHIQEFKDAGYELPVVNQIDLHPFMRHPDIVRICEENSILLEAWAPLARGLKFDNEVIKKIAIAHDKEPAQIFIRWGMQHGFIEIPKTVSQKRIISNSKVFDFSLSDQEMKSLDVLDEYLVTDWDVVDVE